MNKKEVFAHFSSILDDMLYDSLFFCTYFQRPESTENFYGDDRDESLPSHIQVCFGATRGVILDAYYDYVVKFDAEEDAFGKVCEREESLYQAALDENVAQYFTECTYIGSYTKTINFYDADKILNRISYCGYDPDSFDRSFIAHEDEFGEIHPITISIPLYAYPKARQHLPAMPIEDKKYMAKARAIYSPLAERSVAVAIDFIRQYGEEEYRRFSSFLARENINDLHANNFGDVDGKFVCIDYGGYHDWCDSSMAE